MDVYCFLESRSVMKTLSQKFILVAVVLFSLAQVSLFLTLFASTSMKEMATDIFSEQGYSVVKKAQAYVNGNDFENFVNGSQDLDEFYYETQNDLYNLKRSTECVYLYTIVPETGTDFAYIIDGSNDPNSTTDPIEDVGTIFDAIEDYEVIKACMDEKQIKATEMYYTDEWGWIITFYGPILNSSQKVVGVIAADFLVADFLSEVKSIQIQMYCIAGILLVVFVVIVLLYLNSFFKKLKLVNNAMKEIATGETDLTARIPVARDDELGQLASACNEVVEKLQVIMASIKGSVLGLTEKTSSLHSNSENTVLQIDAIKTNVDGIDGQAEHQNGLTAQTFESIKGLKAEVDSLSSSINEQNAAISQSSTAIEEITANIESISRNVNNMAEEYKTIVQEAKDGTRLQELVKQKIEEIEIQAKNLQDANVIITNIAEQTNLLAMNASIEAAHAGKAGAGFSVVAGEIRTLAETSNKQTSSIKELLLKIDQSIEGIGVASSDSGKAFASLGNRIVTMEKMLQQIQDGINEQSIGARHILEMVEVINASAHAIMEDTEKMSDNGDLVHNNMLALSDASDEILKNTHLMVTRLDEIKDSAKVASESAAVNLGLTENLNDLVVGYKTE
ncbi:MAG: methyl-accepting chemotaxis protein [Spirochaetaceae bacterium]|nr:methyl-accepting chemotaxis protein [Spirochaetaceae bacterium]